MSDGESWDPTSHLALTMTLTLIPTPAMDTGETWNPDYDPDAAALAALLPTGVLTPDQLLKWVLCGREVSSNIVVVVVVVVVISSIIIIISITIIITIIIINIVAVMIDVTVVVVVISSIIIIICEVFITSHGGRQLQDSGASVGLSEEQGVEQRWTISEEPEPYSPLTGLSATCPCPSPSPSLEDLHGPDGVLKHFITSHRGEQLEDRVNIEGEEGEVRVGVHSNKGSFQRWSLEATEDTIHGKGGCRWHLNSCAELPLQEDALRMPRMGAQHGLFQTWGIEPCEVVVVFEVTLQTEMADFNEESKASHPHPHRHPHRHPQPTVLPSSLPLAHTSRRPLGAGARRSGLMDGSRLRSRQHRGGSCRERHPHGDSDRDPPPTPLTPCGTSKWLVPLLARFGTSYLQDASPP